MRERVEQREKRGRKEGMARVREGIERGTQKDREVEREKGCTIYTYLLTILSWS